MQQSRSQKILYVVVFVLLIGSLVFAFTSARRSKNSANTPVAKSRNTKTTDNSTETTDSSNNSKSSTTSSSDSSNVSTNSTNQQLVATGPTETIGLFFVTAVAGTAIAHAHQRKTLQKRG